jgi:predicted acyl esterase
MIKILQIIFILPLLAIAQDDKGYPELNYDKQEFEIKMRDGKALFTQVYTPKDKSKKYPIMMQRTC